jgi:hypothetical protein
VVQVKVNDLPCFGLVRGEPKFYTFSAEKRKLWNKPAEGKNRQVLNVQRIGFSLHAQKNEKRIEPNF